MAGLKSYLLGSVQGYARGGGVPRQQPYDPDYDDDYERRADRAERRALRGATGDPALHHLTPALPIASGPGSRTDPLGMGYGAAVDTSGPGYGTRGVGSSAPGYQQPQGLPNTAAFRGMKLREDATLRSRTPPPNDSQWPSGPYLPSGPPGSTPEQPQAPPPVPPAAPSPRFPRGPSQLISPLTGKPLPDNPQPRAPVIPRQQPPSSPTAPRQQTELEDQIGDPGQQVALASLDPDLDGQSYQRGGPVRRGRRPTHAVHNEQNQRMIAHFGRRDRQHAKRLLQALRRQHHGLRALANAALSHSHGLRSVGRHELSHGHDAHALHLLNMAHAKVPDGAEVNFTQHGDHHFNANVRRRGREMNFPLNRNQLMQFAIGPAGGFDHSIDNGVEKNFRILRGARLPRGYQGGGEVFADPMSGYPMPQVEQDPDAQIVRQVVDEDRRDHGLGQARQPEYGEAAREVGERVIPDWGLRPKEPSPEDEYVRTVDGDYLRDPSGRRVKTSDWLQQRGGGSRPPGVYALAGGDEDRRGDGDAQQQPAPGLGQQLSDWYGRPGGLPAAIRGGVEAVRSALPSGADIEGGIEERHRRIRDYLLGTSPGAATDKELDDARRAADLETTRTDIPNILRGGREGQLDTSVPVPTGGAWQRPSEAAVNPGAYDAFSRGAPGGPATTSEKIFPPSKDRYVDVPFNNLGPKRMLVPDPNEPAVREVPGAKYGLPATTPPGLLPDASPGTSWRQVGGPGGEWREVPNDPSEATRAGYPTRDRSGEVPSRAPPGMTWKEGEDLNWKLAPDRPSGTKTVRMYREDGSPIDVNMPGHWDPARLRYTGAGTGNDPSRRVYHQPPEGVTDTVPEGQAPRVEGLVPRGSNAPTAGGRYQPPPAGVGAPPAADDMSPAARATRAYPSAGQTQQRRDLQVRLEEAEAGRGSQQTIAETRAQSAIDAAEIKARTGANVSAADSHVLNAYNQAMKVTAQYMRDHGIEDLTKVPSQFQIPDDLKAARDDVIRRHLARGGGGGGQPAQGAQDGVPAINGVSPSSVTTGWTKNSDGTWSNPQFPGRKFNAQGRPIG